VEINNYVFIAFIKCVNGFNVVFQQCIAMNDRGCQICSNCSRLKLGCCVITPTYYAANKHNTLPSHFKL